MKLSQLCSEPQLTLLKLDDKDVIKEYGEPLEFYTWDRQPMDVFLRLANIDNKNTVELISVVKTLVLDENATPIITDKNMLPTNILLKVIAKVVEQLGK